MSRSSQKHTVSKRKNFDILCQNCVYTQLLTEFYTSTGMTNSSLHVNFIQVKTKNLG